MGLEALPVRWHLLYASSPGSPPRPFLSADVGLDVSRTFLTRRMSDASECTPRGSSSASRQQASARASLDGEALLHGFQSRRPWVCEKGIKGGPSSSSFRSSESPWSGNGLSEQSGLSGLFRWKFDSAAKMRRATRFEDFPGDRWRRPDDDSCEAEAIYQCFERLDIDVYVPSPRPGAEESGRSICLNFERRHEAQGTTQERKTAGAEMSAVDVTVPRFVRDGQFMKRREQTASAGVSAVDVTAPNFVRDGQFMERKEQPPLAELVDGLSYADRQMEGPSIISRPASLKCKSVKVSTSGVVSPRVEGLGRADRSSDRLAVRAEWLSIPDSVRNWKNRLCRGARREGVCAIKRAFDSMVFMIRALQSYTLQMRQILGSDTDVQKLLSMVHREMYSSFVWLFQQVFYCTPTLMVSVMILLANFTVISLGNNIALGALVLSDPSTELASVEKSRSNSEGSMRAFDGLNAVSFILDSSPPSSIADSPAGYWLGIYEPGEDSGRSVIVADGEDGDNSTLGASERNAMFSEKVSSSVDQVQHSSVGPGSLPVPRDSMRPLLTPKVQDKISIIDWTGAAQPANSEEVRTSEQLLSRQSLLEQTALELALKPGGPYHHVLLNQETLRILVAPVATKMESDKYLCFDRTDLEYQHALSAEPANPMLLANYAQFLYVVRHDNSRAEGFFHRALRADSEDGDILGRWASFLWLALKDHGRAETAYRAAIALDPSNPFHAGSYAHFLWHNGDDEGPSYHPEPSS